MEEIFDIVDENDNVTGTATRGEVHGNPALFHRVSHVLVFNATGELFLQKRGLDKDVQPGKWDTSVGGHLDSGETYEAAAIREMEEELGIRDLAVTFLYKYSHANDYETEFVSTFSSVWDGEIVTNSDEIIKGRFWKLKEIEANIPNGIFTPNFLDELKRYKHHTGRY
ncbi:MAG: NUDIX domain-containing protein [Desulfobacterales bacterium]|nr:NUDIX domain-containing protein [Desulfobacterales bacterium]